MKMNNNTTFVHKCRIIARIAKCARACAGRRCALLCILVYLVVRIQSERTSTTREMRWPWLWEEVRSHPDEYL